MSKSSWYVRSASKAHGPFSSTQLRKLATDGKILQETPVRLGEEGKWVPARKVKGLFEPAEVKERAPSGDDSLVETYVPCRHCKKYVSPSANTCRHCQGILRSA